MTGSCWHLSSIDDLIETSTAAKLAENESDGKWYNIERLKLLLM